MEDATLALLLAAVFAALGLWIRPILRRYGTLRALARLERSELQRYFDELRKSRSAAKNCLLLDSPVVDW